MTAVMTSVLRDSGIMTWRNLLNIRRIPDLLLGTTVQPIMFVLLFAYVFAAAWAGTPTASSSSAGSAPRP